MKKKILIFIITYQASYRLKKVFDSIELKKLKNYKIKILISFINIIIPQELVFCKRVFYLGLITLRNVDCTTTYSEARVSYNIRLITITLLY